LRPLAHLSQTTGINLKEIPFHPTRLEVEWEKLEVLWRQLPPAMLVISQASNVCGLLLPVEEIAKQARKANPSVIIIMDGAQAAGLYPLNLQSGLVDYLIWSGHKSFYGPFGVAGIAFCTDKRPEPMLFGGTGTFSESLEMPTQLPSAYEPGSLNSPAIAGLNAALDWLKETEREAITQHATQLMQQLETRLKNVSGVKLVGVTSNQRAPVLSFSVSGVSPQALEEFLGSKGIAVRAGLHCAPWAHRFLDTQKRGGTVRVSFSYFNQSKQIDCLITALETLSN
jgi:selenocysteine lyase/cysteine desulfurase